jgi:hypothetical protein
MTVTFYFSPTHDFFDHKMVFVVHVPSVEFFRSLALGTVAPCPCSALTKWLDFCESSHAYEQPMKSMRATLVVAPAVTFKG